MTQSEAETERLPAGESAAPAPDGAKPVGRKKAVLGRRQIWMMRLLGGAFGLAVSIVILILVYRQDLPRIAGEDVATAWERWQSRGIQDYDLDVEVKLQQPMLYQVSVRQGIVTAVRANGRSLSRTHAFETWSVAGMFETLLTDLDRDEEGRPLTSQGKVCKVLLRGVFDEQYGYPSQVLRIETREKGTNPEVAWRVVRFQIASEGDANK